MRLIDVDKAIEATWEQPTYTDPLNVLAEVRDKIRELPTVDAIPVEWIVEYKEKYSNTSSEEADVIKAETLVDMLADWAERKEE